MRVCIVRNSEAKSNAGILRIVDAISSKGTDLFTLTRTRFNKTDKENKEIHSKSFEFNKSTIQNYELQLKGELGKGLNNLFTLFLYQFLIFKWLLKNRNKYDVLHVFDLDAGIPSIIISRIFRKKMVYHIADFYTDSRQGIPRLLKILIKKLEYLVIEKASVTIICTDERKKQIENSKPKKLYVIYNSPVEDIKLSEQKMDLSKESNDAILSLCYVGGLTNIRFINEIINIVKSDKKFHLNIAGLGSMEKEVIKASEECENINYFGRVNYDQAIELYSKCDVMFAMYDPKHPNHKYSAPNKVYESMMLGKLILVAKNSGIDALVDREKIGFSVLYDEKEFKNALYYILNNKHILDDIKKRSDSVYSKYSWTSMKEKVQKIYEEI